MLKVGKLLPTVNTVNCISTQ